MIDTPGSGVAPCEQVMTDNHAAFISIFTSVLITMIAIGIERPNPVVQATTKVKFATAFLSVSDIVFAYAGHVAFFSFISELKDPKDFTKALFMLQGWDISMYIVASIVIYRYGGPHVESPALGSTSSTVSKVGYGIALPTVGTHSGKSNREPADTMQIAIAGIINAHVAGKYM